MGYFGLSVAISDKIMQRLLVLRCLWHAFHFPMSVLSIKRFLRWCLVTARIGFDYEMCVCVCAGIRGRKHEKLFLWLSHFNKRLVFSQTVSQPQPSRVPTLDLWKKTTAEGTHRWQPVIILLQLHNSVVHMHKANVFLIYDVFLELCIYLCFPQLVSHSLAPFLSSCTNFVVAFKLAKPEPGL